MTLICHPSRSSTVKSDCDNRKPLATFKKVLYGFQPRICHRFRDISSQKFDCLPFDLGRPNPWVKGHQKGGWPTIHSASHWNDAKLHVSQHVRWMDASISQCLRIHLPLMKAAYSSTRWRWVSNQDILINRSQHRKPSHEVKADCCYILFSAACWCTKFRRVVGHDKILMTLPLWSASNSAVCWNQHLNDDSTGSPSSNTDHVGYIFCLSLAVCLRAIRTPRN